MLPGDIPTVLRDGRYELGTPLGQGGMATVFRARDRTLGVQRAIKMLRPEHSDASDFRDRLRSEAQAMARLEHPNILPILDVGTEGEFFYVVMPLADKGSLQDLLKESGPLSWGDATRCIVQVLAALSNAHTLDVVHRDVKPQNILVGSRGQALLADFGIAMLTDSHGADRNTVTGVAMGSPSFMPPEQRVDARSVDHRADIYSAGATFYAMITCRTPVDLYTAKSDSTRWRDVPEPFVRVIRRATAMAPEDRFQTALEMAHAILEASEEAGTQPEGLAGALEGPSGEQIFITADSLPDALTRVHPDVVPRGPRRSGPKPASPANGGRGNVLMALMVGAFLLTASVTTGLLSARAAGIFSPDTESSTDGGDSEVASASSASTADGLVEPGAASEELAEVPVPQLDDADPLMDGAGSDAVADADPLAAPPPAGVEAPTQPSAPKAIVQAAPAQGASPSLAVVGPTPVLPHNDITPERSDGPNGKGVVGSLFRSWKSVGSGRLARLAVSGEPDSVQATFTTVKGSTKEQRSLAGSWDDASSVLTMRDVASPEAGVWSLTLSADGTRLSGIFQPPTGMPRLLSLVPDE